MKEKIEFGLLNSSSLSSFNDAFYYANQHVDVTSYYSIDFNLIQESVPLIDLHNSSIQSSKKQENSIPLGILKNNSSLQAMVVYLHENSNMQFSQIASLLNRDQRTIWATYAAAKRKNIDFKAINIEDSKIVLPSNIFSSRNFSVLETIVFYLKSNSFLSLNEISVLLGKNYRTIWTVYRRALLKINHKNKLSNSLKTSNSLKNKNLIKNE